jgi:transcriptional regulator with XRE-family HTH domain
MISARQIRAARGLLGWDASVLADKTGLTRETISRIEGDQVRPHERTLLKILRAFNENGVEFTGNSGVQLKSQNVEVLEGTPGFLRFYDFVYEHLSQYGGLVCVSGVNEKLFVKYQGDFADFHMKRMADLVRRRDDLMMRILVEEGDYNFVASDYAQYRWQSKLHFSPAPFYVFGDNLALISFTHDPSPLVVFIRSASLAEAYKHSFDLAWEHAVDPPAAEGDLKK